MDKTLMSYYRLYELLGFKPILGYAYLKSNGKKSFVPQGRHIPEWKLNSIQIIPGDITAIVDCDIRGRIDGSRNLPCPISSGTPTDRSQSGACRYWFRADTRLTSLTGDPIKIDLLTGTTPVIAAPSKVEHGGVYQWIVPLKRIEDLKPMSQQLFDFFHEKIQTRKRKIELLTPKNFDSKTTSELTQKRQAVLYENLAEIHDSRTAFKFITWAICCRLRSEQIWSLCQDKPYCQKRGRKWFELSVRNAARKLGVQYA